MPDTLSLALDLLVATLLVVAIAYGMLLNRRLNAFRQQKDELEKLAEVFAEATAKAEEGVAGLKTSAAELEANIETAQGLRDDLGFLIERGSSAADHLEDAVRTARGQGGVPAPKKRKAPMALDEDPLGADPLGMEPRGVEPRGVDPRGVDPRGAEPKGIDPRGVEPRGLVPRPDQSLVDPEDVERKTSVAALAQELRKSVTGKRPAEPPRAPRPPEAEEDDMGAESDAERELLKALRSAQ